MPGLSPKKSVCLDWEVQGTAAELPLLWLTAVSLSFIWDRRKHNKAVTYRECRAEMIGHWNLIKTTKLQNEATVLDELIKNYFPQQ